MIRIVLKLKKLKMGIRKERLGFNEAREIVRDLGLNSQNEWNEYIKTEDFKQLNIPSNPRKYYINEFNGFGDWLGTGRQGGKLKFLPFDDAKKKIKKLIFKNGNDWKKYTKEPFFPKNIPKAPWIVYSEWISMGDWLGTGSIASFNKEFIPFTDARNFARSSGIKSIKEWDKNREIIKNKKIPIRPDLVYEEFINYADWFGTDNIHSKNFLSYYEAIGITKKLGLKNYDDWREFTKTSGFKELNIPTAPNQIYDEFKGYGEWLGTGNIAPQNKEFISFEEGRIFSSNLGFNIRDEWNIYCQSGKKPDNIPSNPNLAYQNEWKGWPDWLGISGNGKHRWTNISLIPFLQDLKPFLKNCTVSQLITIIQSSGIIKFFDNQKLRFISESKTGSNEREKVIDSLINELSGKSESELEKIKDSISDEINSNAITSLDIENKIHEESIGDKTEIFIDQLKSLDIDQITRSLDDERVEFIYNSIINELWYSLLNNSLDIEIFGKISYGKDLPNRIKNDFINEYNEVINLKMPSFWTYDKEPLLMQKLISYRLLKHKRYGNFSGAGAGKTISAILAGRYVNAKNTLIITFNSTIGKEDERGWCKEIRASFKNSRIYSKINKYIKFDNRYNNYLVLNYETFQQRGSSNYVISLLEKNRFDYIILDEVQSIKKPKENEVSIRREIILGLIQEIKKVNPDYYLLAMSATPVINNLNEVRSIIELILFEDLSNVDTKPTVSNCIEWHRKLTNIGIRHNNIQDNILNKNQYTIIESNADQLYTPLKFLETKDQLGIENLLLEEKLKLIEPYIGSSKGKTIIYTYYVDGIEERIYNFLIAKGYRVGVYTGSKSKRDREESLNEFINGQYDILLGSKPISTGVDGLQKISDRIIPIVLPWTHAEMDQLEHRINRKGSIFDSVEVIIPILSSRSGEHIISPDRSRLNRILYKKDIANAVVDGIIPEKIIDYKEISIEKANKKLDEWISRIKEGNILTEDRKKLEVNNLINIKDIDERSKKEYILNLINEENRLGKISLSSTTNKRFQDSPQLWHQYHELREESIKEWDEIPYEVIAKKIKSKKDRIIDLGCGTNKFKNLLINEVVSVDHIGIDDTVIECDMRDMSEFFGPESFDVAIFSLSLWGPNYKEYLTECNRILTHRGMIYIADPYKHYEDPNKLEELKTNIEDSGFTIIDNLEIRNNFIYITAIKI